MNPLHCPLAATDFELMREYLLTLSLDELIAVTEDMFGQLSASEQVTFNINRYCSEYNDYGGRINFFKALFDNGIIAPIHIPYQYQRDATLVDLIRPQIYEYYIPTAHDLSEEAAAVTDDLEETTSDITVTNPRWVHVDETKKEQSPTVAAVGDTVRLLVDISGYPEGAPVTFDIYDASNDPAMRIETERGKNEGGTASIEWVIEDANEVGEGLKLEFEGSARSKSSGKAPIPLTAVYTVELKDEEGKPLEGIDVQFDVAGEKTVVPTNDAGIASHPAKDPSVEADVTILWEGAEEATSATGGGQSTDTDSGETAAEETPMEAVAVDKDAVVTLSDVKFNTPAECLRPNETFDMQCTASTTAPTSSRQVSFHLFCRYPDSEGKDLEEEVWTDGLESLLPGSHMAETDYPLEASGSLCLPSDSIKPGTQLTYWLEARNKAANSPAKGPDVQITYKQVVRIVEVPDVLFHHNGYIPCLDEEGWLISALATALHYAEKEAPREYQDQTQSKQKEEMVIFGHTDTSGEHSYNYDLSEFRARNVRNLLNQNVEDWKQIAEAHAKVEDHQRILKTLTVKHGWDCDPGKVDNIDGPVTRAAVKAFQQQARARYNLTDLDDDGDIGPITWGAIHRVLCGLVAQFMTLTDPASRDYPAWQKPAYGYPEGEGCYGCGESFPIEEKNRDDYRSQTNRRVEILFLPQGQVPLAPPSERNRTLQKNECLPYDEDNVIRYSIEGGKLVVVVRHVDGTWYPDGTEYVIKRLGADIASGQLDSGTTTPIFAFQDNDYQIVLSDSGLHTTIPGQPDWFEKQHVFIE